MPDSIYPNVKWCHEAGSQTGGTTSFAATIAIMHEDRDIIPAGRSVVMPRQARKGLCGMSC